MTLQKPSAANILWFLPTHGDGRYLGTSIGGRDVNFNYLRQIAQAADQLGYFGVLLPTGRSCEDSWVVASAVAPWTERLRYLVAVRPGRLTKRSELGFGGRFLVGCGFENPKPCVRVVAFILCFPASVIARGLGKGEGSGDA